MTAVRLLVDPALLDYRVDDDSRRLEFWSRIVEWAADARACLGAQTQAFLYERFAVDGYPHDDLTMYPKALATEYRRSIDSLLSRVLPNSESSTMSSALRPDYCGMLDHERPFKNDIFNTAKIAVEGLATIQASWPPGSLQVEVDFEAVRKIELCFVPGASLAKESEVACHNFFKGRTIHIVGGQPTDLVIGAIVEVTGLVANSISWTPSEKGKPPRNLKHRWSGLKSPSDITLCVTGRIGHAQSLAAQVAANKSGVPHLKVETVNQISTALRGLASPT